MHKHSFPIHSLFGDALHRTQHSLSWWSISLAIILGFNLILKSWQLGIIPPAMTHDEIYNVAEAQSLSISGRGLNGRWSPWSLTSSHPLFAEWPSLMIAAGSQLFPQNPIIAARTVSVVMGSLLPIILAAITWQLFHRPKLVIMTAILASLNPWLFQISRQNFDSLYSLFWFYLAIWLMLRSQNWSRLWSIPAWTIGFFQYQGLKIVFWPLITLVSSYLWTRDRFETSRQFRVPISKWLPILIIWVSGLMLVGWFGWRLTHQIAQDRMTDVILLNQAGFDQQMVAEARLTLSNFASGWLANKYVLLSKQILVNYFHSFDLVQWFVRGESLRNPTSVWSVGLFYPWEIVWLLSGLVMIWSAPHWRRQAWLLSGIILLGPIPQAINNKDIWLIHRASLMFPAVLLIISLGWWKWWEANTSRWWKMGLVTVTVAGFGYFSYEYFYRYPVYATKGAYAAERVLSSYLRRLPPSKTAVVLSDEARFVYASHLVYNQLIDQNSLPEINTSFNREEMKLKQITIKTDCLPLIKDHNLIILASSTTGDCDKAGPAAQPGKRTAINSPVDNARIFTIYNDQLCGLHSLPSFPLVTRRALAIDDLSDQEFCQTWISNVD